MTQTTMMYEEDGLYKLALITMRHETQPDGSVALCVHAELIASVSDKVVLSSPRGPEQPH